MPVVTGFGNLHVRCAACPVRVVLGQGAITGRVLRL